MITVESLLVLKILGWVSVTASVLSMFVGSRTGPYKKPSAEGVLFYILWAGIVGWAAYTA